MATDKPAALQIETFADHHVITQPNPLRKVPGAIGYDKTWRLFVNVTPEELHGSAGLGRRKAVRKES